MYFNKKRITILGVFKIQLYSSSSQGTFHKKCLFYGKRLNIGWLAKEPVFIHKGKGYPAVRIGAGDADRKKQENQSRAPDGKKRPLSWETT